VVACQVKFWYTVGKYMLIEFWNNFFYQPMFNGLIWIYNNWTDQNFGWAIVYLTIGLRVALLPFTIIDERSKAKNEGLRGDMERIEKGYKDDPVLQKEEMRKILRQRKVQPWAKAVVLGIQALVLVLLYQVFLSGMTGERMSKTLYPWVDFPGVIDTVYLRATHDFFWAGVVGLWLLVEIYFSFRKRKIGLAKSDLMYFLIFPLVVFIVLWILPMVKALFILTSILFSAIVNRFIRTIFRPKAKSA
jgi:membrane protein insertase Oxa1/YidC/SpoIIIJ